MPYMCRKSRCTNTVEQFNETCPSCERIEEVLSGLMILMLLAAFASTIWGLISLVMWMFS